MRWAKSRTCLINVTNDGWFGNTTGPRQHFHQARVRAVESGVPLMRAANNGISALVDPNGRVVAKLKLNERGVIDVQRADCIARRPLYALYGDWIFALNALILLVLSIRPSLNASSAGYILIHGTTALASIVLRNQFRSALSHTVVQCFQSCVQ